MTIDAIQKKEGGSKVMSKGVRTLGEAGYVLTRREYAFLSALVGAKHIYGIEDDTHTLDREALQEAWTKAKENLENKAYIDIELDGQITIDQDLHEMLYLCCHPALFIKCQGKVMGRKMNRSLYVIKEHGIELDEDRLMRDKFILTPLVTHQKAVDNLLECLGFDEKKDNGSLDIKVSAEAYNAWIKATSDNVLDIETMESEAWDIEHQDLEDLHKAIHNKKTYMHVAWMDIGSGDLEQVSYFSMYSGHDYIWIICEEDDKEMHIQGHRMYENAQEVDTLINKLRTTYIED